MLRTSRDSRGSRVDSGSVDMDTPQSLSPRSPLDIPASNSSHHLTNGVSSSSHTNTNNNHVINISSPSGHPVPPAVPVLHPQPITISHSPSPSPATPASDVVMIGGSDSTQSLISDRRVPIVPPRRCRTRSPTPNTSHGKYCNNFDIN